MSVSFDQITGIPSDTDPEAFQVQCEVLRRLSASQRLQMALDLTRLAESAALNGIRRRHPHYGENQLRLALARMRLGADLFQTAFPDVEVAL